MTVCLKLYICKCRNILRHCHFKENVFLRMQLIIMSYFKIVSWVKLSSVSNSAEWNKRWVCWVSRESLGLLVWQEYLINYKKIVLRQSVFMIKLWGSERLRGLSKMANVFANRSILLNLFSFKRSLSYSNLYFADINQ